MTIPEPGITPDQWERDGFICLCELHLEEFKQEGDVASDDCPCDDTCFMNGCSRETVYELYPGLKEDLEQARKDIEEGNLIPFEELKEKHLGDES